MQRSLLLVIKKNARSSHYGMFRCRSATISNCGRARLEIATVIDLPSRISPLLKFLLPVDICWRYSSRVAALMSMPGAINCRRDTLRYGRGVLACHVPLTKCGIDIHQKSGLAGHWLGEISEAPARYFILLCFAIMGGTASTAALSFIADVLPLIGGFIRRHADGSAAQMVISRDAIWRRAYYASWFLACGDDYRPVAGDQLIIGVAAQP